MPTQWAIVRIATGDIVATPTLPAGEHPHDVKYADWSEADFTFNALASICEDPRLASVNTSTWDWDENLTLVWADLRADRDRRLAETDWTQLADVPAGVAAAWQPYRQALRDLPETAEDPRNPVWPEMPQ